MSCIKAWLSVVACREKELLVEFGKVRERETEIVENLNDLLQVKRAAVLLHG